MSSTAATIELVESILGQLGVYAHAVIKRTELAEQLVEQRMSTSHVATLLSKFGGRTGQGGIVLTCLQGDWRTELDSWAFREVAQRSGGSGKQPKESWSERSNREEQEALQARARSNGLSCDEQRRRDRQGAIWARIAYARRLPHELEAEFGLPAYRIVDELRELAKAEPHRNVDGLLADACEIRERKGWPKGLSAGAKRFAQGIGKALTATQNSFPSNDPNAVP